jgi:hypothetical protein
MSHQTPQLRPGVVWLSLLTVCLTGLSAHAKPAATKLFCERYPTAPACASGEVSCMTCHTNPPARNLFGVAVERALAVGTVRPLSDAAFSSALAAALTAAESADSDQDGVNNLQEITAGTDPSDAQSKPGTKDCSTVQGGAPGRTWNVCQYDPRFAYRKVMFDVCGRAPSFAEEKAFDGKKESLRAVLKSCVQSNFWRGKDGVLWNLANSKIRPVASIKAGENAGPVPLADFEDDYKLFVYTQIDNHNAKDLLQADYFVTASGAKPPVYTTFKLTAAEYLEKYGNQESFTRGQYTNPNQRAGMITTGWFRVINTMFTPVPRTTAAQAYRAYLGLDIALLQGLQANAPLPVDYDKKGIAVGECATCHRTLDPLSYPFSRYEAIDNDEKSYTPGFESQYRSDRMTRFVVSENPDIVNVP